MPTYIHLVPSKALDTYILCICTLNFLLNYILVK